MEKFIKLQSRIPSVNKINSILNGNIAAINTVEAVIIIISVIAVIGVIWYITVEKIGGSVNSVGEELEDAPIKMFEDVESAFNG